MRVRCVELRACTKPRYTQAEASIAPTLTPSFSRGRSHPHRREFCYYVLQPAAVAQSPFLTWTRVILSFCFAWTASNWGHMQEREECRVKLMPMRPCETALNASVRLICRLNVNVTKTEQMCLELLSRIGSMEKPLTWKNGLVAMTHGDGQRGR